MNKATAAKAKLLISSLFTRFSEGEARPIGLAFSFSSGLKRFEGKAEGERDALACLFQGAKRTLSAGEFPDWFCAFFPSYDGAELTLFEGADATVIEASDKGVKSRKDKGRSEPPAEVRSAREYVIKTGSPGADRLLKAVGILTKEERPKVKNDMIRKYSQIDHFVELVLPMLKELKKGKSDRVVVWDLACGKSYLSFALYYYLTEVLFFRCELVGIDISEGVIAESRRMAAELGYSGMRFEACDLRDFQPKNRPDLVISLHACDVATDLALAAAVKNGARAIACVPCCHKELIDRFELPGLSALTRGIFRARLNDALTDSLRVLRLEAAGYRVSAVEYISPLDTPKNLLIRAEKKADAARADRAAEEYRAACALLGVVPALDRELNRVEEV